MTKYNAITKTRTVTKTKTEVETVNTARLYQVYNYDPSTRQYYVDYENKRIMNEDKVKNLEKNGYVKNGTYVENYFPDAVRDWWVYTDENGIRYEYAGYFEAEFTNFTKTSKYLADEEYTEYEPYTTTENYQVKLPYTVTEKYQVKVPYKVRKYASITKKIKSKYKTIKKPVYKTVKVKKTGYKTKYVKSSQTVYGNSGSYSYTEYAVSQPKDYTFAGIYND